MFLDAIDHWKPCFPLRPNNFGTQGLDVIFGMDWLSKYGGNIDCTSKSILLTTPEGKRIKYVSRHAPRRTQVNSLSGVVQEEVPVVKDYPDVFPEELPRKLPDRDIEFLIELLPGTGPISKRPYRVPVNDLEEIKKQIKELLEKDTSEEVHHLGEPQYFWLRRRINP